MTRLTEAFDRISAAQKLYLPIEKAEQVNFDEYAPGANVRLDVTKTVKSAKDAFFPQCEDFAHFHMDGKSINVKPVAPESEPFTVFGVRACDARSFKGVLDLVFLSDPLDPYYAARREHGTLVVLACGNPEESCFCQTFGVNPAESADGDANAWIVGDTMYLNAVTEKGEKLLALLGDLLSNADDQPVEAEKARIHEEMAKLPLADLSVESLKDGAMMEEFNSPRWKDLSAACLGCGSCTFVCPTCQCYDIRDFNTGHGVQRYRCWDSCLYSDFTLMAHGSNRPTQLERFRQRFMHKLVYFPMNNNGVFSCVGCGRCVEKCPIHMNIVKVIKALGGKKHVD